MAYGARSAALTVTSDGGTRWSPPRSPLPLVPGIWATTVVAPAVVPHTRDVIVPVLMHRPFPSKAAPLKTWWRLEESADGGRTWRIVPSTPDAVMVDPPSVILQAWITPQAGWVVLGSRLYRTTDGGRRWAGSRFSAGPVVNLSRVSTAVGFVLIQHGHRTLLYRTRDGGVHWFRVS